MSKLKLASVIAANYIPVIFAAICYEAGAFLCLMFLPLHILLLELNNHFSPNRKTLLLLSLNLLISTVAAHKLSWYLYAKFVCNDIVGAALAFGALMIGVAIVVISSLIMLILKKKPSPSSNSDSSET